MLNAVPVREKAPNNTSKQTQLTSIGNGDQTTEGELVPVETTEKKVKNYPIAPDGMYFLHSE